MSRAADAMKKLVDAGKVGEVVIFPDLNSIASVFAQFNAKGPLAVGVKKGTGGNVLKAGATSDQPSNGVVIIAVATDAEADQLV